MLQIKQFLKTIRGLFSDKVQTPEKSTLVGNEIFTQDAKISQIFNQCVSNTRVKVDVGSNPRFVCDKSFYYISYQNAIQIFWKRNISYPLIRTQACAYQGVRNVRFSENLACFVFLQQPCWDSFFSLIVDEMSLCSWSEGSANRDLSKKFWCPVDGIKNSIF